MATDHVAKGKELMAEAQQKLNGKPGGGGLCCGSGGGAKVEQACELYVKAANSFKMAKDWTAAGFAFAEAAALELDNKRPHEAGNHFVEASKCYKKVSTADCIRCLEKAVDVYTDMGKPRIAAKHHQTLAELYGEGEMQDLTKSVHHNLLAAELFTGEESKSAANKCRLQVAKNSALLGDHTKAIEIYEQVGREALESSLLRYTAADLFFRAGLCKLYVFVSSDVDSTASKMAGVIAQYEDMNPAFCDSRERLMLVRLAQAASERDVDAFNEAIRAHESVSVLDPWYHDIIRSIRKYVKGEPDMR